MNTQADPLTEAAFRDALTAAGLPLTGADFDAAYVGAQRLRAQVAELSGYLAGLPMPDSGQ